MTFSWGKKNGYDNDDNDDDEEVLGKVALLSWVQGPKYFDNP